MFACGINRPTFEEPDLTCDKHGKLTGLICISSLQCEVEFDTVLYVVKIR